MANVTPSSPDAESIRENVHLPIHNEFLYDESKTVDNESVDSPKTPAEDTESVNSDVNSTSSDEQMDITEPEKKSNNDR